jgi:predicted acylesterase/phospholipase RssA
MNEKSTNAPGSPTPPTPLAADLRPCDIVMKGGITSGVVYPGAVWEISRLYSFKNVGGTSAGAIAAVVTAAAQRSRLLGDEEGFDHVNSLPDELAKDDLLRRLFRPNISTKALFATVTALVGRASKLEKLLIIYKAYWRWTLAGALPAIILFWLAPHTWPVYLLALCLVLLLMTACAVGAFLSDLCKRLGQNYNGLVTGITDDASGEVALMSWLEERIRQTARIRNARTPLTFAMLWNVQCDGPTALTVPPDERAVNLEMITTNVTFGRPFKFPFDTSQFFFKKSEMESFFPDHVVQWMVEKRRIATDAKEKFRFAAYARDEIYPFPPIGDLPVIVATRMSLAFPVLLCAVPTYAADFNEKSNQGDEVVPALERCWFTDGGLSSNFPLTLFDSPIPRWPTFGINLRPFSKDYPRDPTDESKNVYLPEHNQGGRLIGFNRPVGILGFLGSIFNTMQTWNDTTQAILPGFRDRIVTVNLSDDEGGLNLDMPPEILTRLKARGVAAGRLIAQRFADVGASVPVSQTGWENHRWLRYRTTMGAIRKYFVAFTRGARAAQPSIEQMIRNEAASARTYPLSDPEGAIGLTNATVGLGAQYETAGYLDANIPKPAPELVIRPALDMKA